MDAGKKRSRKPNPRENACPLSAAMFCYTIPMLMEGFKRDLEERDLTETLSEHKSNYLGDKLENAWRLEEVRAQKCKSVPSLTRVLFLVFGMEFMLYGFVLAFSEAIRIVQPIALGALLEYYAPGGRSRVTQTDAYWYAGAVVMCSLLNVLFTHPYMLGVMHLGMKMRIACCSLIYRKSLRLSATALGQTTAGQVVNLLSNDVNRFDYAVLFAHQLWVGPLETIVCTYFMYQQVGVSAVIGVASLLIFIPLQIYLGRKISIVRLKTALRTDERVRLMNEIISGIQVIKMYAWEKPFAELVSMARRYEIDTIRAASFMRGITLSFIMFTTRMSIFVSILAYVLTENIITAEKVFVLTSFYNILRQTMTVFFPQGIAQVAEAQVSISRLNKFMLFEETQIAQLKSKQFASGPMERFISKLDEEDAGHIASSPLEKGDLESGTGNGSARWPYTESASVTLVQATAKWTFNSSENTLSNINLHMTSGKLVAVIGPVGCGKSSLLHTILKELRLESGKINVDGSISYAAQEPWLFAGTVRQNILFGLPLNRVRYNAVVKRCALERDFTLLPHGDKTIVGDRGVSLSGGQRARINLARAVYKQADIYLLDDPLSAVDTHVGKQLFDNCITGFLQSKAVILVTHQLQYLKQVPHIIFLEAGTIKAEGTFKELQATGLDFTSLLGDHEDQNDGDAKQDHHSPPTRQSSFRSVSSLEDNSQDFLDEQKSSGSVGAFVYLAYLRAGGNWCVIIGLIMLFVFAQLLASASDYFITYWVNMEQERAANNTEAPAFNATTTSWWQHYVIADEGTEDEPWWHLRRDICIYVYAAMIGGLVMLTLCRSFAFFSVCMRASTTLHNNMFSSVTRATMRFFNTNAAGRILNRFSKDMGSIDEMLTSALIDCLQIVLQLIGIIVVVAVVSPWLMLPTLGISLIFYALRIIYIRTSRNVKRLEGVTRSPVFSHLNASLRGLATIRAFGAESILEREFDGHQDLHSSAFYSFISTSRAFGYWLDLVCIVYITLVTFSFLVLGTERFGGNVGLAITQAIALTGMFQWGMRQSTELENQMTSVERVLEYTDLESEPTRTTNTTISLTDWPSEGCIQFQHVYLYYSEHDPAVLRDLSFEVRPKEKIGIVGRTGAGKSSLINALFQLTVTRGGIIIDNVDISSVSLHDLRSRISIIPQEPVLFSGTMRKNLDPFDEYEDNQLWLALEAVELKQAVLDLPSGLNSKMSEGGSNFSVGQRQLVCLARAILRNNRILVLDEATANVDPQTDGLIQKTIRKKFQDCTVLTIAHRLNTVMDSDRVMVMDAGTLKEFDHAHVLLQNATSMLSAMVEQTGPVMAHILRNVAHASYDQLRSAQISDFTE